MKPIVLKKRNLHEDPTGFHALREEGIRLAQELSGGVWSDYNLHDPGVTMLESLCYGITDLVHRTGFPTADYLAGEAGFVPEAVGLARPEDILPCGPVTGEDLRRYLFDRVSGVENVWVETVAGGFWRIFLRGADGSDPSALVSETTEAYHAVRNLGEDLREVVVLTQDLFTLEADVEVDGSRPPAEVMAEIYHVCNRLVAPGIRPENPHALREAGTDLDTLFSGPLTHHGVTSVDALSPSVVQVSVTEVIGAVRQVRGVMAVRTCCFFKDGRRHYLCIQRENKGRVLSLTIPEAAEGNRVALFLEGKRLAVTMEAFRGLYSALEYRDRRPPPYDPKALYTLPQGTSRPLGEYTSIQNDFPDVYGINAFGVPLSFPEERKAASRQLKGYLALMEQFLADGMATLDSTAELFSPESSVRRTRFGRFLSSHEIPGMDELRPLVSDSGPEAAHAALLTQHDPFHARRNAFLTHLLSLYGESVDPESLRRDAGYFSETALDEALIKSRIALLKRLPEISAHRMRAFDLTHPKKGERNISILQEKCEILLGLHINRSSSLTLPLTRDGLQLISDDRFLSMEGGTLAVSIGDDGEALHPVPPSGETSKISCTDVQALMDAIDPFRHHLIFESLLRNGVNLDSFRLVATTACQDVRIAFALNRRWIYLGIAESAEHGAHLIHLLRRYLIFLNMATEGMHVVEHLLLRPEPDAPKSSENPDKAIPEHTLSILFPNWTDRFASTEFRTLVMELVAQNLPVHLSPAFHFLDFDTMKRFETLWSAWKQARAREKRDEQGRLAKELRQMLGQGQEGKGVPPAAKG